MRSPWVALTGALVALAVLCCGLCAGLGGTGWAPPPVDAAATAPADTAATPSADAAATTTAAAAAPVAGHAKSDTIRPLHAIHVQNDVECAICHEAAANSVTGTDNLLPTMEVCSTCHDVADAAQCGTCHSNAQEPVAAPRHVTVTQKFPHQRHLAAGMQCVECHVLDKGGEPAIPAMDRCRSCHETASTGSDCSVCHAQSEPLRPVSHVPGWTSEHGVVARVNAAGCESCHTQKDCQDCHSGDNVRPRTHRLNFRFDHALDARSNELDCQTCHEDASFCSDCHRSEHVLPQNHSAADWVLPASPLGGRHAEQARLDLEGCIACHDAGGGEPICADCHGK